MAAQHTDRTFRTNGKWLKVTRDAKKREFTFAMGWNGNVSAYQIDALPFKWIPTWQDAQERAERLMTY